MIPQTQSEIEMMEEDLNGKMLIRLETITEREDLEELH